MAADPLARKLVRLERGNRDLEQELCQLRRAADQLKEEQSSRTRVMREQVRTAMAREAAVDAFVLEVVSAHLPPATGAAADDEISQLEDEFRLAREAASRRLAHHDEEVSLLQQELTQKRKQFQRVRRASQLMASSTDVDLDELARLKAYANELDDRIEDLEATCMKTHCQVSVWDARCREVEQHLADAQRTSALQVKELHANLQSQDAAIEQLGAECAIAVSALQALLTEYAEDFLPSDGSAAHPVPDRASVAPRRAPVGTGAGSLAAAAATAPAVVAAAATSAAAAAAGTAAAADARSAAVATEAGEGGNPGAALDTAGQARLHPQRLSRRHQREERGVQTRYISEHAQLHEQVRKLTDELEDLAGRASAVSVPSSGSSFLDLLTLCLRPRGAVAQQSLTSGARRRASSETPLSRPLSL